MSQKLSNAKGFTLVETSIAIVILTIALLGVASVFLYSSRYNSGATDRAVALGIAQQQMERLRNVPFTSTELTATTGTTTTVSNASLQYTVVLTITDTSPTRKTITIQVSPQKPSSTWSQSPITITTQRSDLPTCKVSTNCWL